jgi:hypothetical protein
MNKGSDVEREENGYSSDNVQLDDSDNERATTLDDGFDVVEPEATQKLLIGNSSTNGSKGKGKIKGHMEELDANYLSKGKGKGKGHMEEPDEEYFSEELESSEDY